MRYQVANFIESEAELLGELGYDELTDRKWIKLVDTTAKNDAQERAMRSIPRGKT